MIVAALPFATYLSQPIRAHLELLTHALQKIPGGCLIIGHDRTGNPVGALALSAVIYELILRSLALPFA
jgi:hypothetical protein